MVFESGCVKKVFTAASLRGNLKFTAEVAPVKYALHFTGQAECAEKNSFLRLPREK
jgi:hypothetical protein